MMHVFFSEKQAVMVSTVFNSVFTSYDFSEMFLAANLIPAVIHSFGHLGATQ